MFCLILPNVHENIIQVVHLCWPLLWGNLDTSVHLFTLSKYSRVKHGIFLVILAGCFWYWHSLQLGFLLSQKLVVRLPCMLFHFLVQVVCELRAEEVNHHHQPVIDKSGGLCEDSIKHFIVPTKLLHDEEVVQLIPTLFEVSLQVVSLTPKAEALVQVQHRHVCEVWYSGHSFQSVKAGKTLLAVNYVNASLQCFHKNLINSIQCRFLCRSAAGLHD
mmetsp:Transcript_3111/g.4596  ORF Transcript_3111/g.4596 Transcript_3111/m.4596 type:complete len:217 (-) Transcript_3111:256-906(-)